MAFLIVFDALCRKVTVFIPDVTAGGRSEFHMDDLPFSGGEGFCFP